MKNYNVIKGVLEGMESMSSDIRNFPKAFVPETKTINLK